MVDASGSFFVDVDVVVVVVVVVVVTLLFFFFFVFGVVFFGAGGVRVPVLECWCFEISSQNQVELSSDILVIRVTFSITYVTCEEAWPRQ